MDSAIPIGGYQEMIDGFLYTYGANGEIVNVFDPATGAFYMPDAQGDLMPVETLVPQTKAKKSIVVPALIALLVASFLFKA